VHGFGSGRCRQPGSHSTDGRKIEMPAFDRGHEAALAPQIWVGLSLTTAVLNRLLTPSGLSHGGVRARARAVRSSPTLKPFLNRPTGDSVITW
jgi:hypothetical protein